MLIWVTALHCEAKPVIDRYRLKKSPRDRAFEVYRGEDMTCIVSGSGKLASAAACAWIAAASGATGFAWINLGIVGAAEHELGTAFLLDKVVDDETGHGYFPAPAVATQLPGSACLTLGRPGYDYREDSLFDMEASGFMHAALRFSSAEMVQAVKIVSDNRHRQTGRNRRLVSDLVQQRMESIADIAAQMLALDREQAALGPTPDSWQRLLAMAHFSHTERTRLRRLWSYLCNRRLDHEALLRELETGGSAGAIIETLERISYRDSEEL